MDVVLFIEAKYFCLDLFKTNEMISINCYVSFIIYRTITIISVLVHKNYDYQDQIFDLYISLALFDELQ